MKMQIESTDQITTIDGAEARLWRGTTEEGIDCLVFVTRVAVRKEEDQSSFERELREQGVPAELQGPRVVDLRMIL
ncbi:MAG: hypothetical protein AB7O62_00225 [Pirellulales bacterium]